MYDYSYNPMPTYGSPYMDRLRQMDQPKPYDSVVKVTGLDGARAYPMPPNSRAALFDANESIMYIKSTDAGGFPTLEMYDFSRHEQQPVQTNYATKDDLETLRKELTALVKPAVRKGKQPTADE